MWGSGLKEHVLLGDHMTRTATYDLPNPKDGLSPSREVRWISTWARGGADTYRFTLHCHCGCMLHHYLGSGFTRRPALQPVLLMNSTVLPGPNSIRNLSAFRRFSNRHSEHLKPAVFGPNAALLKSFTAPGVAVACQQRDDCVESSELCFLRHSRKLRSYQRNS